MKEIKAIKQRNKVSLSDVADAGDRVSPGSTHDRTYHDRVRIKDTSRGSDGSELHNISHIHRTYSIDIPMKTLLKLALAGLGIYIAFRLMSVFVVLFFAYILTSAVLPIVSWFRNFVPKVLAILLAYAVVLGTIGVFVFVIVTPLMHEFGSLPAESATYVDNMTKNLARLAAHVPLVQKSADQIAPIARDYMDDILSHPSGKLLASPGVRNFLGKINSVLGNLITSALFAFVLSIYMVWDHDAFLDAFLLKTFDKRRRKLIKTLVVRVERKLGYWLLGQTFLSIIIGGMTWGLLTLLGIPFALPLAIIAGLLETVPNIGPILSAIPSILVAFATKDPNYVLWVTLGYISIQQLENNLIVPRVMGTAVGVKPTIVILAIYIGFQLFGVVGAILAVPTVALIDIFWDFRMDLQKLAVTR